MKLLSSMNPAGVRIPLSFDFTAYLESGETVASAEVAVTVHNTGVDDHPENLLDGSPQVILDGTTVRQHCTGATGGARATGGLDGVDYAVTCVATTSNARKVPLVSILPVRNA